MLYLTATWLSGLDSIAAHMLILLVYIAGALACAIATVHVNGSALAGFLASTIYVGAGGFSGSVTWMLIMTQFSLAATLWAFAVVPLTGSHPLNWRSLSICVLLLIGVASSMPGAIVLAAGFPVYILLRKPEPPGRRVLALAIYLCTAGVLMLATRLVLSAQDVATNFRISMAALGKGGWLILTAPFKFVAGWLPVGDPTTTHIAVYSAIAWAFCLYSLVWLGRSARDLIVSTFAGASVFVLLVGAARSESTLVTLYVTDRYYHFFLLPLAVLVGILAARAFEWGALRLNLRGRRSVPLILAVLIICLAGARGQLNARIPRDIFQRHHEALLEAKTLVAMIEARSARTEQPLVLADGGIPLSGVHKDEMALSSLLYNQFPGGLANLTVRSDPVSPRDASIQNEILDGWAYARGVESPVCVIDGRLREPGPVSWIDFRRGDFAQAVVNGFHYREQREFRWMSRAGAVRLSKTSASLTLRAYAPLKLLQKKWPEHKEIVVDISLNNTPIGIIHVDQDDEMDFEIPLMEPLKSLNGVVDVTLSSRFWWRAIDVDTASRDEREISIALIAIGFHSHSGGTQVNRCATTAGD